MHFTWSSKQHWKPQWCPVSGVQTSDSKKLHGLVSQIHLREGHFQDEIEKCGKRAENLKVSQLNAVPLIELHCFDGSEFQE